MTWQQLAAGAFVAGVTSLLALLWGRNDDDGFHGLDWLPVELTKGYWTPVPQLIWSSTHDGWRGRATLLKPLSDPESHLFTSNLLFMVTRLDVDGERVLLAVFKIPELEESSPLHIKAECPGGNALECGTATCQSVLQDVGDGEVERHVAVDGMGRIWRLAPQDLIAFRKLAVDAKAEIGEIISYTVASGENCTPAFFFIYPAPPSIDSLLDNAAIRAAMVDPIYRDIHGDNTGNAKEGYILIHEVEVNAYTIFCRKLARTHSSSTGSGEARNAMPGELPKALHELLDLAQKWPEECKADDETGDGTDTESLRATVARVERIRSWALEFRFSD